MGYIMEVWGFGWDDVAERGDDIDALIDRIRRDGVFWGSADHASASGDEFRAGLDAAGRAWGDPALGDRLQNRPELTGVDRDDYPLVGGYRAVEAAALDLTAGPDLDDDPGVATLRRLLGVAVRRGADLATVYT